MNNQKILLSVLFILVLAVMGFSIYKAQNNKSNSPHVSQSITNFEECASAGYPVMESYPRQCRTESGELFVENVVAPNPDGTPTPCPDGTTPTGMTSSIPPHYICEPIVGMTTGYVSGHVTIGPNCPGPAKLEQPCETPPEAYSSRSIIVYESDETTVKEKGSINAQGNYKIALAPGKYFIKVEPAGWRLSRLEPVTITSGKTTVVNFDIDTGIR